MDGFHTSKEVLMGWTTERLETLQDTFLRKSDIEDEIRPQLTIEDG